MDNLILYHLWYLLCSIILYKVCLINTWLLTVIFFIHLKILLWWIPLLGAYSMQSMVLDALQMLSVILTLVLQGGYFFHSWHSTKLRLCDSNLPRITKLVCGRARIQMQVFLIPKHVIFLHCFWENKHNN